MDFFEISKYFEIQEFLRYQGIVKIIKSIKVDESKKLSKMEGLSKMERLFKLAKVSKLPRLHLAHLLYTTFGIFHFAQVLNFCIPSFLKEIILKNLWKFVSTRGWSTLYSNERTLRGALYCVKLGFVSTVNVHGPPSLST